MNKRTGYVVAGAFGALFLTGAVGAGYVQRQVDAGSPARVAIGKSLSERQVIERRRGRMAEVAIAGTTMQ